MQVSRSAIQRGAVGRLACRIRLENESLTIIFSRGCAPHPLSLKTRFSLYNIKVLQLLGNRLVGQRRNAAAGMLAKRRNAAAGMLANGAMPWLEAGQRRSAVAGKLANGAMPRLIQPNE